MWDIATECMITFKKTVPILPQYAAHLASKQGQSNILNGQ